MHVAVGYVGIIPVMKLFENTRSDRKRMSDLDRVFAELAQMRIKIEQLDRVVDRLIDRLVRLEKDHKNPQREVLNAQGWERSQRR